MWCTFREWPELFREQHKINSPSSAPITHIKCNKLIYDSFKTTLIPHLHTRKSHIFTDKNYPMSTVTTKLCTWTMQQSYHTFLCYSRIHVSNHSFSQQFHIPIWNHHTKKHFHSYKQTDRHTSSQTFYHKGCHWKWTFSFIQSHGMFSRNQQQEIPKWKSIHYKQE